VESWLPSTCCPGLSPGCHLRIHKTYVAGFKESFVSVIADSQAAHGHGCQSCPLPVPDQTPFPHSPVVLSVLDTAAT